MRKLNQKFSKAKYTNAIRNAISGKKRHSVVSHNTEKMSFYLEVSFSSKSNIVSCSYSSGPTGSGLIAYGNNRSTDGLLSIQSGMTKSPFVSFNIPSDSSDNLVELFIDRICLEAISFFDSFSIPEEVFNDLFYDHPKYPLSDPRSKNKRSAFALAAGCFCENRIQDVTLKAAYRILESGSTDWNKEIATRAISFINNGVV